MASWESFSDEELLRRICEGNQFAFTVLVRRHSDKFFRLAFRFTLRREEAEDIVQECFIKLWERPENWQEGRNAKFTTWFYRVVVNRCLDYQKKFKPLPLAEDMDIADERTNQEDLLSLNAKQIALGTEIAKLPERQRVALNLCFYEDLSNQEAAEVMGVKLKALQSLLMRAKATLKLKLTEEKDEKYFRSRIA